MPKKANFPFLFFTPLQCPRYKEKIISWKMTGNLCIKMYKNLYLKFEFKDS